MGFSTGKGLIQGVTVDDLIGSHLGGCSFNSISRTQLETCSELFNYMVCYSHSLSNSLIRCLLLVAANMIASS